MNAKIPLLDLKVQYISIKNEIKAAIDKVLDSGSFILGENVLKLEEEFAKFCGCKFAVGVASGTDALELSLRALGINTEDEVITTPFTFIATVEAICQVGAKPVFADIEPGSFVINPELVRKKITQKTKAIIPVHIYGHPCDMDKILKIAKEYNLKIIEDCAQAIGSEYKAKKVGTFGELGCFSFFPSKNLGAYGDGGMVITDKEDLAKTLKMLRIHGSSSKYHHLVEGRNSRLDELQAAILRVKLKYLDNWNNTRRKNAYLYQQYLSKYNLNGRITLPQERVNNRSTYHLYVIRTKRRDDLRDFLGARDIQTAVHYPIPLHLQEVYKDLGYKVEDFPQTELSSHEVLSLPMYPELTEKQISYIAECINKFFGGNK